jgi:hypothetical protein
VVRLPAAFPYTRPPRENIVQYLSWSSMPTLAPKKYQFCV